MGARKSSDQMKLEPRSTLANAHRRIFGNLVFFGPAQLYPPETSKAKGTLYLEQGGLDGDEEDGNAMILTPASSNSIYFPTYWQAFDSPRLN
ncbi:hypothetical protein WN943_027517 [Citrus x changshan-huyou]